MNGGHHREAEGLEPEESITQTLYIVDDVESAILSEMRCESLERAHAESERFG
jgi:hypothetical protein